MGWAVPTDFMKMALRSMKFNTRYQDFATHFPDTRNPTPETYINYQRTCCLSVATFSGRRLGKKLRSLIWELGPVRTVAFFKPGDV